MAKLTTEEKAEAKARRAAFWAGEPVAEADVGESAASIPQDALKTKARLLGVPVSDLTSDQIEEVRANLPAEEPAPKPKSTRRKALEPET